ncbi:MAG: hypothetical protein KKC26_08715 [Nanoarchaeota archaeon]|nr:hypothetical protein [Nanoarchaeota archaeon]
MIFIFRKVEQQSLDDLVFGIERGLTALFHTLSKDQSVLNLSGQRLARLLYVMEKPYVKFDEKQFSFIFKDNLSNYDSMLEQVAFDKNKHIVSVNLKQAKETSYALLKTMKIASAYSNSLELLNKKKLLSHTFKSFYLTRKKDYSINASPQAISSLVYRFNNCDLKKTYFQINKPQRLVYDSFADKSDTRLFLDSVGGLFKGVSDKFQESSFFLFDPYFYNCMFSSFDVFFNFSYYFESRRDYYLVFSRDKKDEKRKKKYEGRFRS